MVCCAVLECVVLACICEEAVQARRTMIVVVFVPEAFLCPSVARSLPPMSRSATCLEYDVLELSQLRSPMQADQRNRFVRAGSRVERGARQMLQVAWTMAQRISCIDPASVILLVVESNVRVRKRQGRERAQILHEAMHMRCFMTRSVVGLPRLNGLPSVQN